MDNSTSSIRFAISNLMVTANARMYEEMNNFLKQIPELNKQAFWYKGVSYFKDSGKPCVIPAKYATGGIFPDMPTYAALGFQKLLNKQQVLDNDFKAMCQVVGVLLENCHSPQEVRDALPDMLLPEDMKSLPRTKEAGYTIAGSYSQQMQYEKYYRKMCLYAAQKLIY